MTDYITGPAKWTNTVKLNRPGVNIISLHKQPDKILFAAGSVMENIQSKNTKSLKKEYLKWKIIQNIFKWRKGRSSPYQIIGD